MECWGFSLEKIFRLPDQCG